MNKTMARGLLIITLTIIYALFFWVMPLQARLADQWKIIISLHAAVLLSGLISAWIAYLLNKIR